MTTPLHGILNLHKPTGPTSHDCVARVRRALQVKRVGHAGTLDPLATGVLPVAVGGDATRLIDTLVDASKRYTAEITLKHGGREIGFARRVISFDGKTMTMTVSLGDTIRNVAVYDKKEP